MDKLWIDQLTCEVLQTPASGICGRPVASIYLLQYPCTAMEGLGILYCHLLTSFTMDWVGTVAHNGHMYHPKHGRDAQRTKLDGISSFLNSCKVSLN